MMRGTVKSDQDNISICSGNCAAKEICIRKVPVFRNMKEEEMGLLHRMIRTRSYRKGDYVFREGEKSDALFIVREGAVKLSKYSEEGKEHVIRFLFPGDFFGQFALLADKRHYADAEVLETARVCRLAREDVLPLLEEHPAMAYHFMLALSDRLQEADEWAGALQLYDVDRRLARMLVFSLGGNTSSSITLPAPKKELAALLGTTPETLSRKLTQLEGMGLIAVNRRVIRILNKARLREMAGEGM